MAKGAAMVPGVGAFKRGLGGPAQGVCAGEDAGRLGLLCARQVAPGLGHCSLQPLCKQLRGG